MGQVFRLAAVVLVSVVLAGAAMAEERGQLRVLDEWELEPVWSGHPVGFALEMTDDRQYVGYYDAERRMTIAARDLGSDEWTKAKLPERVGWDSHNSIVMTVDDDGHLHVTGNMHGHPLVYFRTEEAGDVQTLVREEAMTGELEERVTYPRFVRGPEDELLFFYRDGGSGNGQRIVNVYDHETRSWERLVDEPLFYGGGEMNVYPTSPVAGPDGYYHIVWVWRNTPDAATNHSPSYARSEDLRTWQTSAGEPAGPPITYETGEVVADVEPGEGMINGNVRLGFDSQDRPIVTYHRYDEAGNTQAYAARLEEGRWEQYQISDWDSRWDFGGGGSLPFRVRVRGVGLDEEHGLTMGYSHFEEGSGRWVLDEATLKPTGTAPPGPRMPAGWRERESDEPGMGVRTRQATVGEGQRYVLRWETLEPNRDRPREGDPPAPVMLRLYKLELE